MYSEKIEFFKNVKKYWTSQKPEKTCIVWGMNDPVFDHQVLERIKKIYIDSKTIEIEDGGHFVQEWSYKFLKEALDYLNE
jgi:pimeloyl-ACP methyl ester carboxylesterase